MLSILSVKPETGLFFNCFELMNYNEGRARMGLVLKRYMVWGRTTPPPPQTTNFYNSGVTLSIEIDLAERDDTR
jgi:hypothetical protein